MPCHMFCTVLKMPLLSMSLEAHPDYYNELSCDPPFTQDPIKDDSFIASEKSYESDDSFLNGEKKFRQYDA